MATVALTQFQRGYEAGWLLDRSIGIDPKNSEYWDAANGSGFDVCTAADQAYRAGFSKATGQIDNTITLLRNARYWAVRGKVVR